MAKQLSHTLVRQCNLMRRAEARFSLVLSDGANGAFGKLASEGAGWRCVCCSFDKGTKRGRPSTHRKSHYYGQNIVHVLRYKQRRLYAASCWPLRLALPAERFAPPPPPFRRAAPPRQQPIRSMNETYSASQRKTRSSLDLHGPLCFPTPNGSASGPDDRCGDAPRAGSPLRAAAAAEQGGGPLRAGREPFLERLAHSLDFPTEACRRTAVVVRRLQRSDWKWSQRV